MTNMVQAGLVSKYFNDGNVGQKLCTTSDTGTNTLDMFAVAGAFLILLGFYIVAILILIGENIVKRLEEKKCWESERESEPTEELMKY